MRPATLALIRPPDIFYILSCGNPHSYWELVKLDAAGRYAQPPNRLTHWLRSTGVKGFNANERPQIDLIKNEIGKHGFNETTQFIKEFLDKFDLEFAINTDIDYSNIFGLRDTLAAYSGIMWMPYFHNNYVEK